jgi:hypothetical protein
MELDSYTYTDCVIFYMHYTRACWKLTPAEVPKEHCKAMEGNESQHDYLDYSLVLFQEPHTGQCHSLTLHPVCLHSAQQSCLCNSSANEQRFISQLKEV